MNNLIVSVLGTAYAYRRCDTCKGQAVVRDTQYDAWICFGCVRWTTTFKAMPPHQRRGMEQAYAEATRLLTSSGAIPTVDDVPLERMLAACDMDWFRSLV